MSSRAVSPSPLKADYKSSFSCEPPPIPNIAFTIPNAGPKTHQHYPLLTKTSRLRTHRRISGECQQTLQQVTLIVVTYCLPSFSTFGSQLQRSFSTIGSITIGTC